MKILDYAKSLRFNKYSVGISNPDKYLITHHPNSQTDYMNCIAFVNLCRAHHYDKDNFKMTIPDRLYNNEIGSVKWWIEYLKDDLEKFDIRTKYLRGSLLLRSSYPRHAALIYKNPEDQGIHPSKLNGYQFAYTSIVHVIEANKCDKILKLDGLMNAHNRETLGKNDEIIHAPFEYICTPDKWLQ